MLQSVHSNDFWKIIISLFSLIYDLCFLFDKMGQVCIISLLYIGYFWTNDLLWECPRTKGHSLEKKEIEKADYHSPSIRDQLGRRMNKECKESKQLQLGSLKKPTGDLEDA